MRFTCLLKTKLITQSSQTQPKEERRETSRADRESTLLLPAISLPLSHRTVQSWYFFFPFIRSLSLNPQQTLFFFFFKSPCANFYNRNSWFGLIFGLGLCEFGLVLYHLVCLFFPLTYCYLNPQRTCFLSPCENFYSKNYLFVLIFGLGL